LKRNFEPSKDTNVKKVYPNAKLDIDHPTNAYDKIGPIFLKKFFFESNEKVCLVW